MENLKIVFNHKKFKSTVSAKIFDDIRFAEQRLTLDHFSKQIGISKATLSRISCGKTPDVNSFLLVCNWLSLNPAEFMLKEHKQGSTN